MFRYGGRRQAGNDVAETTKTGSGQQDRSRNSAWTVEALADLLEVSPKTLYKMANSGRIPVIRIAGMLRFDPVLVADWLRARTTGFPKIQRKAA